MLSPHHRGSFSLVLIRTSMHFLKACRMAVVWPPSQLACCCTCVHAIKSSVQRNWFSWQSFRKWLALGCSWPQDEKPRLIDKSETRRDLCSSTPTCIGRDVGEQPSVPFNGPPSARRSTSLRPRSESQTSFGHPEWRISRS